MLIALFMLPFALLCYPAGRLADRIGWFAPMLTGNILFGLAFASYGFLPAAWLPLAMVASGIFSALMFTPNLLLISDLVRRGHGEGLFGAFQVAGSLGFLTGPIAGGILVSVTRNAAGVPAYREILAVVGAMAVVLAAASFFVLRRLAREVRLERATDHVTASLAQVRGVTPTS
jgi:MFS family permease